jgi:hypothetical protein
MHMQILTLGVEFILSETVRGQLFNANVLLTKTVTWQSVVYTEIEIYVSFCAIINH